MAIKRFLPLIAVALLGCSGQQTEAANMKSAEANRSTAAESTPSEPQVQPIKSFPAATAGIVGAGIGEPRQFKEGKAMGEELLDAKLVVNNNTDITLEYTNNQRYGIPLMFSSGMTADLWLLDPQGQRVWAWSNEMMFTQAIREGVMPAGKTQYVKFKIPADIAAKIGKGYSLKAIFAGRATESQRPAMHPVIYHF
ncbi:BsuPI-related putative proteinase inhibitor [Shewanella sp. MBTL60-007]|uniref:BsuPI-related putative proteinase inhibitor n=1 Tax=Shewanella sp. MBTL60-007 TaxID=2815911 RepID=UPI001BC3AB29|nr:BsuPI-related putative proteinase inhibitor [Shewanella sp. MBTL60-007]GIU14264.1 proteinase inhibitor [Shewanella sp. MBTL60-007]